METWYAIERTADDVRVLDVQVTYALDCPEFVFEVPGTVTAIERLDGGGEHQVLAVAVRPGDTLKYDWSYNPLTSIRHEANIMIKTTSDPGWISAEVIRASRTDAAGRPLTWNHEFLGPINLNTGCG